MKIVRFLKSVGKYIKENGFSGAADKVDQMSSKTDIIKFYDFVINQNEISFSEEEFQKYSKSDIYVNWFIPEMGVGSGGHINIFRFVEGLQERGIKNRVYVTNPTSLKTNEELRTFLYDHYNINETGIELIAGVNSVQFSHASVATSWQTAYFVNRFNNTLKKFYFVQDFEPYFYAKGSEYSFAENTYKLGFCGITAGGWLKEKLSSEYGMKTEDFNFSYDDELYTPHEKRDNVCRVFFYARPVTQRRSFEMGLLALNELSKQIPDIEVVFAGWDVSGYEIPFTHLNAGNVHLNELSDLYGQCDICIVLSATNLSLLPLEVMASGSVVACDLGPQSSWLMGSDNAILLPENPIEMARVLAKNLKNPILLSKLRAKGMECAKASSWENEFDKIYNYIIQETFNDEE